MSKDNFWEDPSLPSLSSTQPVEALAISSGIAIGPARIYTRVPDRQIENVKISPDNLASEQQRLDKAMQAAVAELAELTKQVARTVGAEEAQIFEAQQLMLQDPDLLAQTRQLILENSYSASWALKQATEQQARELEELGDEILAARATDLRDATERVIRLLEVEVGRQTTGSPVEDDQPAVLVAYQLTPSDTAGLNFKTILGICTVEGGPTDHAAILARARKIPAISGIEPQLLNRLQPSQQIAIDGTQGLLYLHLDEAQQKQFNLRMEEQRRESQSHKATTFEQRWSTRPGATADGYPVQVFANVGGLADAQIACEYGAEGIGLLRTEFFFGDRTIFPGEEEQFETYVEFFRAFSHQALFGKTVVARTLDVGGDKPFPALQSLLAEKKEENPALGLRGVRLQLLHQELLRQQLRALLRAGAVTDVQLHIMFPMVTTLEEVRRLKAIYKLVWQELQDQNLAVDLSARTQLGIMVETPAAAIMVDELAREVDFLSIGTNDLYQYTMAADRTNRRVMSLFKTLEPAVWRLIARVISKGQAQGRPVSVCGELAGNPEIGPLLAGLGAHRLSVASASVINLKAALYERPLKEWQELAKSLLSDFKPAETNL
ncbi:MAG TPA: phosphoenolpyruvate--protein phosphotransferase [Chloroflexia bacterium]|nr:phosphoenolpyruvate--protein phosphotransferase [Chloroflexia bacterium]